MIQLPSWAFIVACMHTWRIVLLTKAWQPWYAWSQERQHFAFTGANTTSCARLEAPHRLQQMQKEPPTVDSGLHIKHMYTWAACCPAKGRGSEIFELGGIMLWLCPSPGG